MSQPTRRGRAAGAFDIRVIIAALFGLYGVVVTVMGLFATSAGEIEKAAGININLWSGIGMLVFAALFVLWAWWRPIIVADGPEESSTE